MWIPLSVVFGVFLSAIDFTRLNDLFEIPCVLNFNLAFGQMIYYFLPRFIDLNKVDKSTVIIIIVFDRSPNMIFFFHVFQISG